MLGTRPSSEVAIMADDENWSLMHMITWSRKEIATFLLKYS